LKIIINQRTFNSIQTYTVEVIRSEKLTKMIFLEQVYQKIAV